MGEERKKDAEHFYHERGVMAEPWRLETAAATGGEGRDAFVWRVERTQVSEKRGGCRRRPRGDRAREPGRGRKKGGGSSILTGGRKETLFRSPPEKTEKIRKRQRVSGPGGERTLEEGPRGKTAFVIKRSGCLPRGGREKVPERGKSRV